MAEPQAALPGRHRHSVAITTIVLGVLTFCALLLRCVSIAEPLGIDQSLWASAARGMSRGQLLYRDVWEQRPPGIYFVYLAGFDLLGWSASTVVWLDNLAAAATAMLLYGAARGLGNRLAGVTAACFYAVLTMPAWVHGHGGILERSVCETFVVVAVGFAAWCAVRLREHASLAVAFGLGLSAGAAVVLKPNAGIYFPALLLWLAWYRRQTSPGSRAFLKPAGVAVLGAVVVPAATLAWLWHLGLLEDARTAVVDFNRYYVAEGFGVGAYALAFSKAVWLRMKTDPLWLAGGAGALAALWVLARDRSVSPLAGLGIVWGAGAALAIAVNGARLFNTYFIQAWPPLALLAAWLLTEFARGSRRRGFVGVATAGLMLVLLVQRGYAARVVGTAREDLDQLRGRTDRTAYLQRFGGYGNQRGYSARANEELAEYVRARTTPDERVFLFGINGAGVYFLSDRLTAHRFLRVNFFVATDFPDPRFRLEAVAEELAANRPRYLIFEHLPAASEMAKKVDHLTEDPVIKRLLGGYRFETRIEDFTLYRRRDGGSSPDTRAGSWRLPVALWCAGTPR
jgi:Dolichyl-phosphate-mannose-protein mannosyltransferase